MTSESGIAFSMRLLSIQIRGVKTMQISYLSRFWS